MAYSRIFGGGMAPHRQPMPGQPSRSPAPAPFDLRKSALDYSLGEIASVQPRLGASDRMRVESYQDSLRDIEKRLAGLQGGGRHRAAGAAGRSEAPAPSRRVGAPMDSRPRRTSRRSPSCRWT